MNGRSCALGECPTCGGDIDGVVERQTEVEK